ncbi:hypothetical protein [Yeosuana sp. AK3]
MKKVYYIFLLLAVMTVDCTGIKSTTKGLESEGYIEIVKSSRYRECTLQIDNNMPIKVRFNRNQYSSRPKGKIYAVSTGKHEIKIFLRDELILKNQIFIGAQETRKIILP